MKKVTIAAMSLTAFGWAGSVNAAVMDFGTGGGASHTLTTPFVQDGITMTPLDDGSGGLSHWDLHINTHFASGADRNAAIHSGNNGGDVKFEFGGGLFNLDSIYVEGVIAGPGGVTSIEVLFTGSDGSSHTVNTPAAGLLDFSGITGFTNITWFTMDVIAPAYQGACQLPGAQCTHLAFDDVTLSVGQGETVPTPAALGLIGFGLAALGIARRKRQN